MRWLQVAGLWAWLLWTAVGWGQMVYHDLPYGPHPLQRLNLYVPVFSVPRPRPVMIYVHGGAWRFGDKSHVDYKDEAFLRAGYLFVSINYRLAPEGTWREMASDVAAAVAWVVQHIEDYGGDPQRVFLMGHSAGAHLATLVATDPTYLQEVGLGLNTLRAVVALDTRAYDLEALARLAGGLPPAYRSIFGDDPREWRAASPISYVVPGRAIPPMAVVWSRGQYRAKLSGHFIEALQQAGIEVLLVDASYYTHRSLNKRFGTQGDPVAEAILPWLRQFWRLD